MKRLRNMGLAIDANVVGGVHSVIRLSILIQSLSWPYAKCSVNLFLLTWFQCLLRTYFPVSSYSSCFILNNVTYLFHMSPRMPAPRGIVCSSQLALRAAALSFVGLRFISVILLNLAASDYRVISWLARKLERGSWYPT